MSLDKNEKLDINDVFTVDKTESRKEESIFTLVVGCLYTRKCVLSVEVGLSTRRKRVYTKKISKLSKKNGFCTIIAALHHQHLFSKPTDTELRR